LQTSLPTYSPETGFEPVGGSDFVAKTELDWELNPNQSITATSDPRSTANLKDFLADISFLREKPI